MLVYPTFEKFASTYRDLFCAGEYGSESGLAVPRFLPGGGSHLPDQRRHQVSCFRCEDIREYIENIFQPVFFAVRVVPEANTLLF